MPNKRNDSNNRNDGKKGEKLIIVMIQINVMKRKPWAREEVYLFLPKLFRRFLLVLLKMQNNTTQIQSICMSL